MFLLVTRDLALTFPTAFGNPKPVGVNPRNTSYDFVERPGEHGLPEANLAIVERWFVEEGVGMPHHKDENRR